MTEDTKKFNWNALASISAVFAALTALLLGIYQYQQAEKGLSAQNVARLELAFRKTSTDYNGIVLRNEGNGVAFIKSMRVSYNDSTFKKNASEDFLSLIQNAKHIKLKPVGDWGVTYLVEGNALRPGRELWLLKYPLDSGNISQEEHNEIDSIYIELEYENIFGDPGYVLFNTSKRGNNTWKKPAHMK